MKKVFCIFVLLAQIPSIGWADACQAGYQPVDYQVLEYIESTGTQYIDTDIEPEPDCELELKYRVYALPPTGVAFNAPYGAHVDDSLPNVRHLYSAGTSQFLINTDSEGYSTGLKPVLNVDYTEHMFPSYWVINGTRYNNITTRTQTVPATMKIFNRDASDRGMNGRFYYFKMWNNGTLVRNLIPARRNSDNVLGMYDTVSGRFFTNAGTGTFIAGPEKPFDDVLYSDDACVVCPPNTYKDTVGNVPCTPCPTTTFSKSGSTSINDCGHVMHVGDKIYFLNSQKLTTPALHVRMPDGTIYYGSLYRQQTE